MVSVFKTGDTVRCLQPCNGQFTPGNIYEVGGIFQLEYERCPVHLFVGVVADDQGRPNGWNADFFKYEGGGPW